MIALGKGTSHVCGIAGILTTRNLDLSHILESMALSLRHRGPDASGIWSDPSVGVGLAHRRLSILDLTESGNQPMISKSGRYVISYNGEIYNHSNLRRELDAVRARPWRGRSDTEVLLSAIEQWEIAGSLQRINGMFAFAVWDRVERKLTLARDRMGEKPLYIGWVDSGLVFASELKAFRCMPHWKQSINRKALGCLLRYGYIPAPLSIHDGIYKLPPSSSIEFRIDQAGRPLALDEFASKIENYWSLPQVALNGISHPVSSNYPEVLEALQNLIDDAVRIRMEADVPVGVLLSGGIDSSLVSAVMQRQSAKPVRTFTIGFTEDRFDEAQYAKKIAEFIGSEHTDVRLSAGRALDIISRLPEIYDEPFADSSQVPTALVSATARQHVTVALSGDGGDELFLGYRRYFDAIRIWGNIGNWPPAARRALAAGIRLASYLQGRWGFRMRRLQNRITAQNFDDFYSNLSSLSLAQTSADHWPCTLIGTPGFPSMPDRLQGHADRMMFADQSFYLPEDILVKVDRASMAVALELRPPLLDYRIVEYCWRIPESMRFDGHSGKVLLRNLLHRYIPQHLVERPKHGFDIPIDTWLRKPLRNWMLDLLNADAVKRDGYLNGPAVSVLVAEHLSGQGDHGYALWALLMFQAWLHYGK